MKANGQRQGVQKGVVSRFRFVATVILCLFVLYTLMYFFRGSMMSVIEWGMLLIGNSWGMSAFVFLMIIIGGWMWLRSFLRMFHELEILEDRKFQYLRDFNNSCPEKCYTWLKENKEENTLLYRRLEVLFAGRSASCEAGEQKLPIMEDLHEITLQRELSNWDSAGMNTIISFLLILGILGTLTGVHEVLNTDEYGLQLSELAPALQPSVLAVFGTVILMTCRDAYLRRVDSYLGILDEVTIKCILPKISHYKQNDDAERWNELIENLKGMDALNVPEFRDDSNQEGMWKDVKHAREISESQIKRLRKYHVSELTEASLPPKPAISNYVPVVVPLKLSEHRIRQGEALTAINAQKIKTQNEDY